MFWSTPLSCCLSLLRAFEFAFDIARAALKGKLPEIHLKFALYLEDEVCVCVCVCENESDHGLHGRGDFKRLRCSSSELASQKKLFSCKLPLIVTYSITSYNHILMKVCSSTRLGECSECC